jgi:hypothetical protein
MRDHSMRRLRYCAALLGVLGCVGSNANVTPTAAQSVPLSGHVISALASAHALPPQSASAKAADSPLLLTVILRRSDQLGFEQFLKTLYDPNSKQYRHYLSPQQVAERFGPSLSDYQAVRMFFTAQGLAPVADSANRLTLTVTGSRSQIERALAVGINDYDLHGKRFYANDRDPRLPIQIAAHVQAVIGLSDLAQPKHLNTTFRNLDRCARNAQGTYPPGLQLACALTFAMDAAIYDVLCAADVVALQLAAGGGAVGGFAVGTAVNAFTGCHFVYPGGPLPATEKHSADSSSKGTMPPLAGTGQKIGLVQFDSFRVSDVANFLAFIGFAPSQINRLSEVKLNGGAALGPDQSEVLIDIAQVMTLAPGASIVVYDAPFSAGPGYQAMFNRMLNDGMTVVSNSWSYCESQTTLADVQSIDSVLAAMAASGVSVFSASGDTGSTCLDGSANTIGVPADSPHITAVGGSSLNIGQAPLYNTERWWDGSSSDPPNGQGGFGVSRFFSRPGYQNGFGTSSFRSIPDVVAAADPVLNGKPICQADNGGCPSGLFYGGTSVAAPLWAAIIANLNAAMPQNIGFLNPQIYPLATSGALHSAGELESDFAHVGLGSPNAARLYLSLRGQALLAVSPSLSGVAVNTENVAADGVTSATLVVQLRDLNGLPVPGKNVSVTANVGSNAQISPLSALTSSANGAAEFTITDPTIETVVLTARNITDAQNLASVSVHFVSPPASGAGIFAIPTTVTANGTSTATVVVYLLTAQAGPASGKQVRLEQGSGHSVILGGPSNITAADGTVQFNVSNRIAEAVIYTAIDVTDGTLPVPGSATVTFDNSTGTSCVPPAPIAADGFSITPFASGFVAENFFFGNVNWGACPGASTPAFDTAGNVFISDFRSGDLFRFSLAGGTATTPVSNLAPTTGQPTFGLDGKLYVTHGATTGNFTTGNLVEIDPLTGNTLRVVASNLVCPNGLSVDPLSGDLFFDDACFGAGSENPSIFRVTDPSATDPNRPTAVVVYATLPQVPNGALSFAPDGTLYALTGYAGNPNAPVVAISGTDQAQPATVTALPGVTSSFWLTVGATLPNGAAKTLIAQPNNALTEFDISAQPMTSRLLATGIGSGTIGPDGCLYAGLSDTVFKLTPTSGNCAFASSNHAPAIRLTPATVLPNPAQGTAQTFTAQLSNISVGAGQTITFQVRGANHALQVVPLNADGSAQFTYSGLVTGSDTVQAGAIVNAVTYVSNPAQLTWGNGLHATALDFNSAVRGGITGASVSLSAHLIDLSTSPQSAVSAATITFTVSGPACSASTNAGGLASCTATLPGPGVYTLTAHFAGSAQLQPATASTTFFVTSAIPQDGAFLNGFE